VADLPGIRLHEADDIMALVALVAEELGRPDPDLPYWSFPWAGGLAIARHMAAHSEIVTGRVVIDVAAGSGVCGIMAARLGAASVTAVDPDPIAAAAITLNARANGVDIDVRSRDVTMARLPRADVILAGDVCYQEPMATRILAWLRERANEGSLVLLGDPGRPYLPPGLEPVARYQVRTSRELEPSERTTSAVYRIMAAPGRALPEEL
jgi:predicted nicotinamide N-methyase